MPTLLEKIENDFREAMKAHDAVRVSALRMLMSQVKNAAIAARTSAKKSLDDADVEGVIRQEVKKIKDALLDFTKAARTDLADAANAEIKLLSTYLPTPMSVEEVADKVEAAVERLHREGVKEFGKVMGVIMKEIKGRADGHAVTEAVKKALKKFS